MAPLGEPFEPQEPEWLIRANAGFPPIQPPNRVVRTSKIPEIIPPIPQGDTADLKVWHEYWKQHDAAIRKDEREKVLNDIEKYVNNHAPWVPGTDDRIVDARELMRFTKSLRSERAP